MSKRIIWIEDDAYIIGSVVRPLEERGYEIEIIENMRDALDRIEDLHQCDLILLDVILPAGGKKWERERYVGLAILEHLREQSVITPILAFTVVQNQETREKLRKLGVVDILNKPILPSELEKAVLAVFGEEA
jgi:CheY-like chemotaxis protein